MKIIVKKSTMDTGSKNVLSLGILIVIVVCKFLFTDCINFEKYDFRRYRCIPNGTTFRVDNVLSSYACGKLCHNSNQCTSFSYQPNMLRCIGCRRAIKSYINKDGSVQYSSKSECPNGWIKNKDRCYYVHNVSSYYPESENFCRQLDAHLVHLETQDENAFLKGLLMKGGPSSWIGMTSGNMRKNSDLDTATPFEDFDDYCDVKQVWDYKCDQFFHGCSFRWLRTECNTTKATPLCEV